MNRSTHPSQCAGHLGHVLVVLAFALALGACGSDSSSSPSVATTGATSSTSAPQSTEPAPEPTTSPVTEPDIDLAALLQPIIDASLEPGAFDWNCCGVDVPPTSVRLGVRVDGYDDILLSSGTRLDDTPALAADPIPGNSLGHGLVRQATLALIAAGAIDPAATIDQWFPDQPNADRVTVQMLLDNTHGWATSTDFITENLLADLTRTWTLAETLGLARSQPPIAEPGTFDATWDGNTIGMIALAGVLEQVTGSSLADIVRDQVTEPLGLTDTFVGVGSDDPADLQLGLFVLPGGSEATDPRALSSVAFRTIDPPSNAVITTVPDLLELLDAWSTGDYPGGIRATSANFPALDGQVDAFLGHGVPFNGYCPCEPAVDGITPAVTGRQPNGVGNNLYVYNYADGISVVLQYNSDEITSKANIRVLADEVHDTVASAVTS